MNFLRRIFWRSAHQMFHGRKPPIFWEVLAFVWVAVIAIGWLFGLAVDPYRVAPGIPGILPFMVLPLLCGFALRRVRLEMKKGSDALYRQRVKTHG